MILTHVLSLEGSYKYDFVPFVDSYSSGKEICDDELCKPEKDDSENFFLKSMELDEIETSCSPIEIDCTDLNIHNTSEGIWEVRKNHVR